MKKFINAGDKYVDQALEGMLCAFPNHLRQLDTDARALIRVEAPVSGKVAIVTGGGFGHVPLFLGYVGPGLADGVAVGNVFSSCSIESIVHATEAVHAGAGVLYIYGNYMGDALNFEMAQEECNEKGIHVESVAMIDDVASAPASSRERRRGIAGLFFAYKIAGAYAEKGARLAELKALTENVVANTCSMGVALASCTIPAVGKATFEIGDNEMELGMGIHGEQGVKRMPLASADQTTEMLLSRILEEPPFKRSGEVAVLVNSLGATPLEELFIINRRVHQLLKGKGFRVHRTYVGQYSTSMEMAGLSISLIRLDDQMKELLDAPAASPFLPQWTETT
jgi:phosphoenolpyruvate---glycerone phosphotransferase subunit DhaK